MPRIIKKSFDNKKIFYLYRSLITGQKRGVKKSTKDILKSLQLIHLLTPSGLHFSSLLIILVLLRKKFRSRYLLYFEVILCIGVYLFVPGYYSLRRVAFLRFLFLINLNWELNLSKEKLFSFFFLYDLCFGTFILSPISFSYSMLFLTIIFLTKKVSFLKLVPLFFLAQLLIAFINGTAVNLASLVISPIVTWLFTLTYPLLFMNLIFIKFLNYSQYILDGFVLGIEYIHTYLSTDYDLIPNLLTVFGIIIIGNRTALLSSSLIIISLLIPNL